jgi:endonuclease YncB( thermonuclease family)
MSALLRQRIGRAWRRHSRSFWLCAGLALIILLLSVLDHSGAFGYRGNDWRTFDQRSFLVKRCLDGGRILVASAEGRETAVHLLGVDAPRLPDDHYAADSLRYASARIAGRAVTLKLEPIQSRDENGDLLAYVFITDGDNLNLDIVRDGQAYADRRVPHTFASQFAIAENEARKKPRGLWVGLRPDQMPQWRRQWLQSLRGGH